MGELGVLRDLVVLFGVAIVAVFVVTRLRLPSVAGFIAAGIVIGPGGLGLIGSARDVEVLADLGVVLLLFGIGLELSFERLRALARAIFVGGTLQVCATTAIATAVAHASGRPLSESLVIGMIVSSSSTAIVLAALHGHGQLDAPHGRFLLGVLLFQDLAIVPMISAIPILGGDQGPWSVLFAVAKALAIVLSVGLLATSVVPRLLRAVARTGQRDLFVLTTLVICLGTAWAVSAVGVSLALGAFLGGAAVARTGYRHQVVADLVPFREVFAAIFFVSVGMLLEPAYVWSHAGLVVGIALAIVLGKGVVVAGVCAVMRSPIRVASIASIALAHVGEFAFVLGRTAQSSGAISAEAARPLLAAGTLSILGAPLLFAVGLRSVRRSGARPTIDRERPADASEVVIAGYGLAGQALAKELRRRGVRYRILELDVESVRKARRAGEPAAFGDVTRPDVLVHVGIAWARELFVLLNDPEAADRAVRVARAIAPELHITVRARHVRERHGFIVAGATDVIVVEEQTAGELLRRLESRLADELSRTRAPPDPVDPLDSLNDSSGTRSSNRGSSDRARSSCNDTRRRSCGYP
jgi:CPA2 family monovalent cation:H+ antiporter-2